MDPVVTLTLRLCFALLFAAAAAHKVRDPLAFRDTLGRYEIVPAALVGPVGVVLMVLEMLVAVTIFFARPAALAAAAVLAAYTVGIAVNLMRGRTDLGCGCMGPAASAPISGWLVARNVLLVLLALAAWAPVRTRPLDWMDLLTVVAATATLGACWLAVERMLATAPSLARLRSASR
jgi:hypothetical protein